MVEEWEKTYSKEVQIYDDFSRFEDEGNRALSKLLKKYSFKNKIVLEIGCGSGKYTELLSTKSKKYYALEISTPLINFTKKRCRKISNIEYLNSSAEKINLPDNSVDVVFASWVLTAMESDKMRDKSMNEINRVLKDNGDIWLFENFNQGEFMDMRGNKEKKYEESTTYHIQKKYGFKLATKVNTNFSFPNLNEAKRVLGFIFGNNAINYLEKNKNPKLKHQVVILHGVNKKRGK